MNPSRVLGFFSSWVVTTWWVVNKAKPAHSKMILLLEQERDELYSTIFLRLFITLNGRTREVFRHWTFMLSSIANKVQLV